MSSRTVGDQPTMEWGEILPDGWTVQRLKHLCEVFPSNIDKKVYEGDPPVRLCNYTDVYYNDRITNDMAFMEATATPAQIERFTLRAGDTIITKDSETADDIAIAAHVPDDLPGVVCGYHLAMVRPRRGVSGAFVKWWFGSHSLKGSVQVRANGLTRVGLGQSDLDNLTLPCPPLPVQAAIAAFLDRETAKIDALVDEQRRLLDLLREKRGAVISHAVTKGLDPNVQMKPSGVEWLGAVPEHWEVGQLKRSVDVLSGYAFPSERFSRDEADIRLLRGVNIAAGRTRWEDVVHWERMPGDDLDDFALREGDVVLGMDRPWIEDGLRVARLGPADVPALLLQRVAALRPKPELLADYLMRLFQGGGFFHHCFPEMTGVSVPHISPSQVGTFVVAIPPVEEQWRIEKHLIAATEKMDRLGVAAQSAIRLLHERRAALISAAVTGNIDVREHMTFEDVAE